MKNYKIILYTLSIIGLMVTSCEDPSVEALGSKDSSQITYLPLITLTGGDVVLDCDATSYTDPGAVATAAGEEIELFTNVTGLYFGSSAIDGPDAYTVAYSAFNDDDIAAAGFRYVDWYPCAGDLVTSIAGTYTATSVVRTPGYSTGDLGPIIIKDLGDGMYAISDAIGGWYEHEYGYGPDYAAKGLTIKANNISTNDFTLNVTPAGLPFGGGVGDVYFTDFSVDAGAGTISMTTLWEGYPYEWKIKLTQN